MTLPLGDTKFPFSSLTRKMYFNTRKEISYNNNNNNNNNELKFIERHLQEGLNGINR